MSVKQLAADAFAMAANGALSLINGAVSTKIEQILSGAFCCTAEVRLNELKFRLCGEDAQLYLNADALLPSDGLAALLCRKLGSHAENPQIEEFTLHLAEDGMVDLHWKGRLSFGFSADLRFDPKELIPLLPDALEYPRLRVPLEKLQLYTLDAWLSEDNLVCFHAEADTMIPQEKLKKLVKL